MLVADTQVTYRTTDFIGDMAAGKTGESIFVDDFLNFLHVNYQDVTGVQGFQVIDSDYLATIGMYEVKSNYKDDKHLCIEEYTNVNKKLAPESMGWFYKSKANMLVFVSKATRTMILVPFTDTFKSHYEAIKGDYELILNKISIHGTRRWQSAFRKIPLSSLNGYFAYYKKVQE